MSLVLLGQMEMIKKSGGMLVAFINYSKAYDRANQEKLWMLINLVVSS